MLNYVQRGEVVTRVAPPEGCRAGVPIVYGDEIVVPIVDASSGELVACLKRGVVILPTDDTFSVGMLAYWDAATQRVVATPSEGARVLGYAQGATQFGVVAVSLIGYNPPAITGGTGGLLGVYGANGITGGGSHGVIYLTIDTNVVVTKNELGGLNGASLVGISDLGFYYDGNTVEDALQQLGPLASLEVVEVAIPVLESSGSADVPEGYNAVYSVVPASGLESHIKSVGVSGGSVTVQLASAQQNGAATVYVFVGRAPT